MADEFTHCPACGSGKIHTDQDTFEGATVTRYTCENCNATGAGWVN